MDYGGSSKQFQGVGGSSSGTEATGRAEEPLCMGLARGGKGLAPHIAEGPANAPCGCALQLADLETLKQSSRLVHYCATPLLFDPAFRQQIQADQQAKVEGKVRGHCWWGGSGQLPTTPSLVQGQLCPGQSHRKQGLLVSSWQQGLSHVSAPGKCLQ